MTATAAELESPRPPTWQELLAQQELVLSRQQALTGGLSPAEWEWRIGRTWQRSLWGVAVAHTGPLTQEQQLWSAVLYAGQGARLSGDAALVHKGFTLSTLTAIDVAVPEHRRVRRTVLVLPDRRVAVVPHRVTRPERWAAGLLGLPTLSVHAAVLHAAAWAPTDRAAEWRLAAVVQQRLSPPVRIREALAQMPSLRRAALIAEALDDVELGAHAASELAFLRFCREHGCRCPTSCRSRCGLTACATWTRATTGSGSRSSSTASTT